MGRGPPRPERGPTSPQLAIFTDGGRAPEQRKQVMAGPAGDPETPCQAGAEAEANRRLLRLFRATRPEEPSPQAWEQSLTRLESALLGGALRGETPYHRRAPAPAATGSAASIGREQS
jgi:hypothetical protein